MKEKIKPRLLSGFLYWGKRKARLLWLFFNWNSSAENFHLWTALQKMSNISLEGFYWYKDNLSGRRFFGENFQAPRNKDLAFESFLFLVTMTSTNLRSHDLKIDRWIDKDRYSHTLKPGNSWDEHFENLVSIQHLYWIKKHLFIQ